MILDHIGALYLQDNMNSLSIGGRMLLIGVTSGIKAELNLARMMVKRQQIIGSVLRSRSAKEEVRYHSIILRSCFTLVSRSADRAFDFKSVLPFSGSGCPSDDGVRSAFR